MSLTPEVALVLYLGTFVVEAAVWLFGRWVKGWAP